MTALTTLLSLASALVAASMSYVVADWGASRSSIHGRYSIWTLGFWAGPLVGALTFVTVVTNAGTQTDSPPVAMIQMARATDHLLVGTAVVSVLAIIGLVAAWKLIRLVVSMSRVRVMIGRARMRPCYHSGLADQEGCRGTAVLLSEDVGVPVLAGLLRPVVLLPADAPVRFSSHQIALICEHEFTHARRGDNLRLWLEEVAAAALWWSPPTMLARRRLVHAREASCDAIVLRQSSSKERVAYAATLLQVLGHHMPLMTAYSAGGAPEVTRRIRLLLAPNSQPKSLLPAMLAFAGLLTTLALAPVLAGRSIRQTGMSFALSTPIDISFRRTGGIDVRTGRPLYRISFGQPKGTVERLLSLPLPQQIGTVDMHRDAGGGWSIKTG